jgi:2-polyprenyl-3-methyl-5-hydroxy-6-metoxy-1,4-benzoquinol methylase
MAIRSVRQRILEAEMLDGPLQADADLAGNLRDLARINRWTGGDWLVHRAMRRLLAPSPTNGVTVLDVGGGRGDGVAGAVRWTARRGLDSRGILLDASGPVLQLARGRALPDVRLLRGDGGRLPFKDQSVDIVTCSLLLHHFSAAQAPVVLGEMARVARRGVIVDDLLRSHIGYLGALVLGRVCTRNRLTRHDGPLSVRRAFTLGELSALLASAGLRPIWQATIPGYRTVVAARPVDVAAP